jgi:hypothetical protein
MHCHKTCYNFNLKDEATIGEIVFTRVYTAKKSFKKSSESSQEPLGYLIYIEAKFVKIVGCGHIRGGRG